MNDELKADLEALVDEWENTAETANELNARVTRDITHSHARELQEIIGSHE